MINATKEKLASFFQANLQFEIPFFQRQYVWEEENWKELWEHLEYELNEYRANKNSEHFIGTIITKHKEGESLGQNIMALIDGQQRLTTISLLLKAIANSSTGEIPLLKDNVNALLKFKDSWGNEHIRLIHSKNDREYYYAIINDTDLSKLSDKENKILCAYNFFIESLSGFSDLDREALKNILLNAVPIISMMLAKDDDEQEIFDTINSLGVRLTTGELLKNHIFSQKEIQGLYSSFWFKVFEEEEDVMKFWNKKKTSGRIPRANIEVLLYAYLIIKTGKEVKLDTLFKEYKIWLKNKSLKEKKEFLNELKICAEIYYEFPEGDDLKQLSFDETEKRFFHVIENLEITTVLPLVLFIYKTEKKLEPRNKMLVILESYLVRRNVCRLTTKNYNKLFIQIIEDILKEGGLSIKSLMKVLQSFKDDTNKFPTDLEFTDAFYSAQMSNANAREILFCIALFQVRDALKDVNVLKSIYTTEHIMPIKWEANWSKKSMNDLAKLQRGKKIKTLGNLTLVTGKLNSTMQNSGWQTKKNFLLKHSMLKITTNYLSKNDWNESEIEKRAKDLAEMGLKIWA